MGMRYCHQDHTVKEINMPTVIPTVLLVLLLVLVGVLASILTVGLVAGIVALAIWQSPAHTLERWDKKQKLLLQNATSGEAKIIEVGVSFTNLGTTNVALRLEVTPQFGESFNVITVWSIEPVHLAEIQASKSVPGKIVEIQAGKSKTKKLQIIFPDVVWAKQYYWYKEFTGEAMKTTMVWEQ
jgi:hypothetical protein